MTITNDNELAERLAHYDSDQSTPEEAYALFEEARGACPVAYSRERGGYYLLMDHRDVKAAHTDWQRLSGAPSIMRPLVDRPPLFPLEVDPPVHTGWRRLFTEAFNTRTPGRIEARVREDIGALIDGFAGRGECDLVAEFIEPSPLHALCIAIGIDPGSEKARYFHELADQVIAALGSPELLPAVFGRLIEFGLGEVQERRANPRDDYLTWLATEARLDGKPLGPMEIGPMVAAMLVAGQDTGVNGLSGVMYEVLSRPDVRDRLIADPSLIPAAVDEGMRLHPPFFGFYRRATADVEFAGVTIPEGSDLQLCWAAANRDPAVYPEPNTYRLDRPRNRHLSFGWGLHACPGQPMAQMQMRVALAELLRRLPDIELADPERTGFAFSGGESCGVKRMPVRFTAER
jgi:cytochrome P450